MSGHKCKQDYTLHPGHTVSIVVRGYIGFLKVFGDQNPFGDYLVKKYPSDSGRPIVNHCCNQRR